MKHLQHTSHMKGKTVDQVEMIDKTDLLITFTDQTYMRFSAQGRYWDNNVVLETGTMHEPYHRKIIKCESCGEEKRVWVE